MCEEIDRRFGEDPDPALRREVARLLYKGDALVEYDQPDEAAAAMDTIVALYGEDADPGLIEVTAHTGLISPCSARSMLAQPTTRQPD